jgi:hypothetical protein
MDGLSVCGGDAGTFLAAVLEGEDAVEGGAGYVFTRGVNAKDAALVLPSVAMHR